MFNFLTLIEGAIMAVTKLSHSTDITPLDDSANIKFICPVCKAEKVLQFPKSVITQAKGLSTMSIARGLVCEHQFQAFVDKNCAVRGYQRVDFEFEKIKTEEKALKNRKNKTNDDELFKNLILEGDYLEYIPIQKQKFNNKREQETLSKSAGRNLSLQEIYNEFWEFIDKDNPVFQTFIKNDIIRK